MALGPAAGLDARYARIGCAAFALARRICGDDVVAAAVVEQAFLAHEPSVTAWSCGVSVVSPVPAADARRRGRPRWTYRPGSWQRCP